LRISLARKIAHLQDKNGRESQTSGMKQGVVKVRIINGEKQVESLIGRDLTKETQNLPSVVS
jgi:hypothetical protein